MFPLILCGICGGLVTICGKLALAKSAIMQTITKSCVSLSSVYPFHPEICWLSEWIVRGTLVACMLGLNMVVLSYFLKAMEQNHTVVVIVITSALNFITSGLFGWAMLGEKLSTSWFAGSGLILVGMMFVGYSQGGPQTTTSQLLYSKKDFESK